MIMMMMESLLSTNYQFPLKTITKRQLCRVKNLSQLELLRNIWASVIKCKKNLQKEFNLCFKRNLLNNWGLSKNLANSISQKLKKTKTIRPQRTLMGEKKNWLKPVYRIFILFLKIISYWPIHQRPTLIKIERI